MRERIEDIIVMVLLAAFIVSLGYSGYNLYLKHNKPKYKVGDCVREVYVQNEFQLLRLSRIMYEVLMVGEKSYLINQFMIYDGKELIYEAVIPFSMLDDSILVNCDTGAIIEN